MNREFPGIQAVISKGKGITDKIANIYCITEKARQLKKKKSTSASLTILKPLIVWITTN